MIYAVNKLTKEHEIKEEKMLYYPNLWRFVQADADGWIEWSGGECPLPMDSYCDVRYSDGDSEDNELARNFLWFDDLGDAAIIAYRPIRTDRERWIEAAINEIKAEGACSDTEIASALYDAGLARLPGE